MITKLFVHKGIIFKMMCIAILVLSFFLVPSSVNAVPPDIGNNSFFSCGQICDNASPSYCYGDINWETDKKGLDKDGKSLSLRKARKIIKSAIKYFKKQMKKSIKQGDSASENIWSDKLDNARQSKIDLRECLDYYGLYDDSDDDSDSNSNPPALVQACQVITSPSTEEPRSRSSFQSSKKFIVNGYSCSNASTSPVLTILVNNSQFCTGTLILPNTVLTAAHCLEDIDCEEMRVANSDASQSINVASCIAHSGYSLNNNIPQKNDVAILYLESDFIGITPVKINTLATSAEVGDLAVFAGYGIDEDDNDILKASFNYISSVKNEVISTEYAQGDINRGTTCSGDSGGPLFVYKAGEWKTHGTLSDGSAYNCALPGTTPTSDTSNWANLTSTSNQNFIKNNTDGVLD